MSIAFDTETIRLMRLFEQVTGAPLKDCIVEEASFTFIVDPGNAGKAIGKGGANVRRLESQLKRKIKIVEYSPDVTTFVKGVIAPLGVQKIELEGDVVTVTPADSRSRSLLIGRSGKHLRETEAIVKRHFPIKEIKVSAVL